MASKFAHLGSAMLFRSLTRPLFPKTLPSSSLRFFPPRFCYSSAATADPSELLAPSPSSSPPHPWPEWIEFIDRLIAKGYLTEKSLSSVEESNNERLYKDINLLKDACLSFARDRYDVFKWLSMKDIEVVVGGGCPNLLIKSVYSAKRLRAYMNLDEGDACRACNLRGLCDRANVILKESESYARTLDIVCVLLFYALDPTVISGGEKPVGRELVESSAKKLLSELLQFSDRAHDPALAKLVAKVPKMKERPPSSMTDDKRMENFEMKTGDWMCHNCNFMNFARNLRCLKCKDDGPTSSSNSEIVTARGDWTCPECSFMNFSRNKWCLWCKAEGPKRESVDAVEMKKGDWNCPQCQFMNSASNKQCQCCYERRPKRPLIPGEWECPSCNFLNYRRTRTCLRCNRYQHREDEIAECKEYTWRRPVLHYRKPKSHRRF